MNAIIPAIEISALSSPSVFFMFALAFQKLGVV